MADAGLIGKLLLDEVDPAIENGTADSRIEIRKFTDAEIDGVPGTVEFDVPSHPDQLNLSLAHCVVSERQLASLALQFHLRAIAFLVT